MVFSDNASVIEVRDQRQCQHLAVADIADHDRQFVQSGMD